MSVQATLSQYIIQIKIMTEENNEESTQNVSSKLKKSQSKKSGKKERSKLSNDTCETSSQREIKSKNEIPANDDESNDCQNTQGTKNKNEEKTEQRINSNESNDYRSISQNVVKAIPRVKLPPINPFELKVAKIVRNQKASSSLDPEDILVRLIFTFKNNYCHIKVLHNLFEII